jgi:leader peptidase (prepilin peptidase)/N-methyltransferase
VTALAIADWGLVVAAPFIGSFVGVLIDRLPARRPLVWARSRCGHCDAVLAPRDLVPLASWLATRGRCRHCGVRVGWFYPAVEVAALGIAIVSLTADRGLDAWVDAALGWWLLALAWIDWRHLILPDLLTLPLIALGLAAAWVLAPGELWDRVAGAACGYLGLWLVAWAYRRLRGREGLGLGDAKLLAAAGGWVGASGLPSVLAGAAIAGLATAGGLMATGTRLDRHSALPFGPFLAAATWLVWLLGPIAY